MTSASTTTSAAPGRVLLQAAGAGQTGTLVVDSVPGGALHLVDGLVTYVESPAAPGVGELLTASGRLAPRTWEAAVDAGTPESAVGRLLVDQGHLTRGELELCVLGAIYDAAFFALRPTSAPVTFVADVPHWLGPVVRVDAAAVAREARRRGRLLDEIFAGSAVDTAPVTPVPRPPVDRVALTAGQWELLVHADGQRTPADLAQLLGRAGYATLQDVRRLAARGLIELPGSVSPAGIDPGLIRLPRGSGPAVDVTRPPTAGTGSAAPTTVVTATDRTGPDLVAVEPAGAARTPRLPRRRPNARLPKGLAAVDTPIVHTGTDEVLLTRIRTALRALR